MKPKIPNRAPLKQKLPDAIVNELLYMVRSQFCTDMTDEVWFRDNCHFIKVRVIFWPATFMVKKGFTIGANRYLEIMKEIFRGIQQHGETSGIKHWPRYLAVCVQRHFQNNWETYYNEAKSAANQAEIAILGLKSLPRAEGPDVVSVMAAAQRLMTGPKKRKDRPAEAQGEFAL